MPVHADAKNVASGCLQAWSSADLEGARSLLRDDVIFVGPLAETAGADGYIEGIKGMVKIVERAEQQEIFGEGENVCIAYDLVTHTPRARIPTVGWYRVTDGKVVSVRAYFDPRPLLS